MSEFGLLIGFLFIIQSGTRETFSQRDAGATGINWNTFIFSVDYLLENILGFLLKMQNLESYHIYRNHVFNISWIYHLNPFFLVTPINVRWKRYSGQYSVRNSALEEVHWTRQCFPGLLSINYIVWMEASCKKEK